MSLGWENVVILILQLGQLGFIKIMNKPPDGSCVADGVSAAYFSVGKTENKERNNSIIVLWRVVLVLIHCFLLKTVTNSSKKLF